MIRRIPVGALRPGMFIHELDCGWLRHPFLRSRFRVTDEGQVRRIVDAGIGELTIDTSRGDDVVDEGPHTEAKSDLPGSPPAPAASAGPDVEEQFREARRVHAEAQRVIHELLSDVRLGRQISVEHAEPVVERIADSILHNPGPLLALCRIKSKDEYTFQHSVSVSALMMLFCRAAGLPEAVREAGLGGLLHDMGKMTTPEEILNKPGKLTDEEFEIMRTHVRAGLDLLKDTSGVTPTVRQVIGEHHERADGSGYPIRLKLADISRLGQMAAIVDVYDAITSDRVYHKGMSAPEAMKKLLEWSEHHFDPGLVRTFIAAVGIYPIGTLVMLESGRLAVVAAHSDGQPLRPRVRVVYDTLKHAFVQPYDVDLARSTGHGGGDRILRHEPARKWSFNPLSYLGA